MRERKEEREGRYETMREWHERERGLRRRER